MSKKTTDIVLSNFNKKLDKNQEKFFGINAYADDMTSKKRLAMEISDSFRRQGEYDRADYIKYCNSLRYFAECELHPGDKHLIKANFCKDRFCPVCNYLRSQEQKRMLLEMLSAMANDNNTKHAKAIFVTFTVPNVTGAELNDTVDKMQKAISSMVRGQQIFRKKTVRGKTEKPMILGTLRSLEITAKYSKKDGEIMFHPHYHVLMMVKASYFKGDNYVSQDKWADIWKHYMGFDKDEFISVNVKRVKDKKTGEYNNTAAVAETAKYAVKDTDIVKIDGNTGKVNNNDTDYILGHLATALKGRQMTVMTGVFREFKKYIKSKNNDIDMVEPVAEVMTDGQLTQYFCKKCGLEMTKILTQYHFGASVYNNITSPENVEKMDKAVALEQEYNECRQPNMAKEFHQLMASVEAPVKVKKKPKKETKKQRSARVKAQIQRISKIRVIEAREREYEQLLANDEDAKLVAELMTCSTPADNVDMASLMEQLNFEYECYDKV